MNKHVNKFIPLEGDVLFFDTETSGLDPHSYRVWSVQIGDRRNGLLLTELWKPEVIEFLRAQIKGKTLVAHNAKFDLLVSWVLGLRPSSVFCTAETEKVIMAGKAYEFSLKATLSRRKIVDLDKTERTVFYDGTFERMNERHPIGHGSFSSIWTPELIDYAFEDIAHLPELYDRQQEDIEKRGIETLIKLENRYVFAAASIEFGGIRFDVEAAKPYGESLVGKRDAAGSLVNTELAKFYETAATEEYLRKKAVWDEWETKWKPFRHLRSEEAKAIKEGLREIKPYKAKPKHPGDFNVASPMQLKLALRGAGVFTDSTAKDTLNELAGEHPVITDLLQWREYEKLHQLLTTVNDFVNPATGNIHPGVNQNVSSGRQSMYKPNLQQIPARSKEAAAFRALFVAEPGTVFVNADYAAFELIALGVLSNDANLLYALKHEADLHCYTMSKFLGCDSGSLVAVLNAGVKQDDGSIGRQETDAELETVIKHRQVFDEGFNIPALREALTAQKWVKILRGYIKTMTYGLAYGLSPYGMSIKFGCSVEAAEGLQQMFFGDAYPALGAFLEAAGEYATRYFITMPTSLGRQRLFHKKYAPSLEQFKAPFEAAGFDSASAYEAAKPDYDIAKKEYRQAMNRIKRQAGNFLPQGTNADAIKLACVYLLAKYPAPDSDVRIALSIHDELLVQCPIDKQEQMMQDVKEAMERAAGVCLKRTDVTVVKPKIITRWEK
jgi:DNA polymerase I-like protein with 3'-5' exonuclease and polymerase domains